jgi:hypothetical protein
MNKEKKGNSYECRGRERRTVCKLQNKEIAYKSAEARKV